MANIIRWNPFREMADMQRQMDRLFDDAWRGDWSALPRWGGFDTPALDIHEDDQHYTVEVPLAGVKPEDINVKMQNGVLTISGEIHQSHNGDENRKPVVQERYYGKFSRSVALPQSVDSNKVEASYDNGVLTLTLPKLPEAQPKQIEVKTGKLLQPKN
jgi:HSP20 family protein